MFILSRFFTTKKPPVPSIKQFQEAEHCIVSIQQHIYCLVDNPATSGLMDYHQLDTDMRHLLLNMRRYDPAKR